MNGGIIKLIFDVIQVLLLLVWCNIASIFDPIVDCTIVLDHIGFSASGVVF